MTVSLHPLTHDDGPRVLAWRNSEAVAPFMYSDAVIGAAEHARWLQAALSEPDRIYWIIRLDDQPVGLANLARIDRHNRRCEWAYYLAEPAVRGRGVGQAVEFSVLGHVFETLGLNKLWCEVFLDNEAVWRLHERFGFTREALYRQHVVKGGTARDVVGLGMLASDWPTARAAALARFADKGQVPARIVA
jgi:UDP-4-amino-4,6-dideoxy-N-acetyl-beta-L-altrosamine N-acetyltransferase